MRRHELVVVQVRIGPVDAVDLLALAAAQRLVRVETADRGEQSLSPQDLMQACNTAREPVGGVEERSVRVGDLDARAQQRRRHGTLSRGSLTGVQQFDGLRSPYRPVSQQT